MRLQSGSPGLAVGDADNRYLRLTGGTLAGNLNVGSGRIVATAPAGTIPQSGNPSAGQTLEHTWNGAGNTWTAFSVDVTNTASGANSKLLDLMVSGVSQFNVSKSGLLQIGPNLGSTIGYLRMADQLVFECYGSDAGSQPLRVKTAGGIAVFNDNAVLSIGASIGAGLSVAADGVLEFNSGSKGTLRDWKARRANLTEYLDINEMTAPSAPAANTARLYVEDNGSGKTRLMVLFPSGAAQQVAIEP